MAAREYDDEPWVPDEWDGTPDVLPDWWLVAAGDGMKPSAEQMAALVAAHGRITRFRGDKMSQTAAVFVRSVVRDVLYAAPQPVTRHWVNYSLTVVSGLVRMCEDAGIALTRQRVFSERTRQRFLHVVCADHVDMAQAGYRSRLDVISGALSRSAQVAALTRPTISAADVLTPYSAETIVDVRAWVGGIRPATRRQRTAAILDLGLGIGARRRDVAVIRGCDVSRDATGVHVTIGGTSPRTVTCLARHEDSLWASAQQAGGNLIVAPTIARLSENRFQESVNQINALRPPAPIMLRRLRNTWLIEHLAAGTPLNVLLPAAGLTTAAHLMDLLPHVPAAVPAVAVQALRRSAR
ncbi:hypothetical protein [Blastococcus xanthinilyticus]|uniref:Phage integrase family protein n=1 Tax=Blastococcus xanthinilyticus TaxID=1564164 RepID=A0A5S5CTT7_9ACTN|nr:hypothetical protein [Blastococcus xanthinilyticus]TYP87133.1 hypothetical protein BD833_10770 [Blastococcus xanthinilyticus]